MPKDKETPSDNPQQYLFSYNEYRRKALREPKYPQLRGYIAEIADRHVDTTKYPHEGPPPLARLVTDPSLPEVVIPLPKQETPAEEDERLRAVSELYGTYYPPRPTKPQV